MPVKFNFNNSGKSYKTQACPISYEQVDKHLVKAYSSLVLSVLLFSIFTGRHLLIYFITFDFLIRVFAGIKYSPLCKFLTHSLKITSFKPVLINAGTKKISAQAGLIFCLSICIFHLLNWQLPALLTSLLFAVAISIDLIFDYCLACKMQSFYLTYLKHNR